MWPSVSLEVSRMADLGDKSPWRQVGKVRKGVGREPPRQGVVGSER